MNIRLDEVYGCSEGIAEDGEEEDEEKHEKT